MWLVRGNVECGAKWWQTRPRVTSYPNPAFLPPTHAPALPSSRPHNANRYFDHFQSPLAVHIEDEVSLVSEFKVDPNNPDNAAFNRFNDALLKRYSGAGRRYHRGAIVGFGLYVVMLRHWMNVFPANRFRVVFLEEWRGGAGATTDAINELFAWLGLPPRTAQQLGDTARSINPTSAQATARKPVTAAERKRLQDFYRPFNAGLEKMLGRKLPKSWYYP